MTLPMRLGLVCAAFALLCPAAPGQDEATDLSKKQAAAVESAVKKLELKKIGRAEGKYASIVTTLPEDKAKLMAQAADKFYEAAVGLLKFDDSAKPWPGKLAIYVFAERSGFTDFLRTVEMRRPEPEDKDSVSLRGDTPHLAMFLSGEGKNAAPAELEVGEDVAGALFRAKAGAGAVVPTWLKKGFTRAVRWKLNPQFAAFERGKVRPMLVDGRKGVAWPKGFAPVKVPQLWGDELAEIDRERLAASVIEFMTAGPDAAKFGPSLSALRESDENKNPNFDSVMKAFGKEKAEDFEAAWKAWAVRR